MTDYGCEIVHTNVNKVTNIASWSSKKAHNLQQSLALFNTEEKRTDYLH